MNCNCTSRAVPQIPGRLGPQRISQRAQLWDPSEPAPEKPARLEQQGHRRPSTKHCNCGTTTTFAPSNGHVHNLVQELHELQAFCTVWTMVPVVAKTGNQRPCPRTARQRQNSALSGPRQVSLNHDGHVKTLSKNCTSENLKVFCTVWTIPPEQDVDRTQDLVIAACPGPFDFFKSFFVVMSLRSPPVVMLLHMCTSP